MPIQQMMLGTGAVATKTYVDDVFNIDAYVGDGYHPTLNTGGTTSRDIVNGIDFTEGGLAIFRRRETASWWQWVDTVNGATNSLATNSGNALDTNRPNGLKTFNNNGVTIGYDGLYNFGGSTVSWNNSEPGEYVLTSLRKSTGFLDIVEFTETGSDASISHQLGSVPGMIIIKTTSRTSPWFVYHRASGEGKWLNLGATGIATSFSSGGWGSVTSSSFNFTHQVFGYGSGTEWIAYVFAGGESDAATARSVGFSSSSTYLSIPDSNDFDFGSTFTFEAWVKPEFHSGGNNLIFEHGSFQIAITDTGRLNFDLNHVHIGGDFHSSTGSVPEGQWTHVAVVGTSGTLKMYINGVNDQNANRTGVDVTGDTGAVTISDSTGYYFKGEISNLRIVKGTAVYASSFRPPTEPLTNITNTKLLCCNNSSTTGSTVTPGTITANGNPTASSDSPFDDPAGFVFGDAGDQNVIKCGSYVGDGVDGNGPEVYLGWEPQWILIKRFDDVEDWVLFDTMRGVVTNDKESFLIPNTTAAESSGASWFIDFIDITSTGFKIKSNYGIVNGDGGNYSFTALRRPDGYVGKPPSLGTDVFAMDTGAGSSTIPNFDSGFPVDFVLGRTPASSADWNAGARLIQTRFLDTNDAGGEHSGAAMVYDSNVGWNNLSGWDSGAQSWMWKRHAGFDVVTYKADSTSKHSIPHQMGQTPEFMWVKNRDNNNRNWAIYHKGLNGGTNPEQYYLEFDTGAEASSSTHWSDTAPTAFDFTIGNSLYTNEGPQQYIAILFASANDINGNPISKVGYYTGNGTSGSSTQTITTGFQPRFVIIKRVDTSNSYTGWIVFDTTRGWGSGDDEGIFLNSSGAQSAYQYGTPTSTGFTLVEDYTATNSNNGKYIYYAHA